MSLQIIENPTNIPAGFVDGYQRQNTQSFAVRVGLDTTEPFDNGTTITVPVGGIVEAGGILYRITSQITLTKSVPDRAWWIVLVPATDGLTASLALHTSPGVWDSTRQGCYITTGTHAGRRTLNWVSWGNPLSAGTSAFSRTTKGPYTVESLGTKGWYVARLRSGLGMGNGAAGDFGQGGGGGVPNSSRSLEVVFFHDGQKRYSGKVGGNGFNGNAGTSGTGGGSNMGGGGGGGGGGEETTFETYTTWDMVGGTGGNGGTSTWASAGQGGAGGTAGNNGGNGQGTIGNVGGGGGPGGSGQRRFDNFRDGGGGGGGGGNQNSGNGGTGGNGGRNGIYRDEGASNAGFCNIFRLGN